MSQVQTEPNQYLCYECALWHDASIMQSYACVLCEGRKCLKLHSTNFNNTCSYCKTTNLCSDCLAFSKCCHTFDGATYTFVGKIN